MDRCDDCAFVYADVPNVDAAGWLRSLGRGYAERLTTFDVVRLRARPEAEPDTWSPLEYSCHVRDVFGVQRERILLALAEATPTFVPMGRDARVVDLRYNEQDPLVAAVELRRAADELAATFEALDDAGWARTGIYNWPTSSERDITWLARHTVHEGVHHLRDVDAGLR